MASLIRRSLRKMRAGATRVTDALTITDNLADAGDAVQRARRYLDREAPALTTPLSGARDLGLGMVGEWVGTARNLVDDLTGDNLTANEALPDWSPWKLTPEAERANADKNRIARTLAGAKQVLDPLSSSLAPVREPVYYGINRATMDEDLGGPWSGKNAPAVRRAAREVDNPVLRGLAQAGVQGVDIATNPLTYVPVGGAATVGGRVVPGIKTGLAGQLTLGAAGVGGFGGATLGQNLARGAAIIGSANVAGALADEATDNPAARFAARLAAPAVALTAGRHLPGAAGDLLGGGLPDYRPAATAAAGVTDAKPREAATKLPEPKPGPVVDDAGGTPDLVALHGGFGNAVAGVKQWAAHPRLFAPLIGAAVGYGSGDSTEERIENAIAGGLAGIGVGLGIHHRQAVARIWNDVLYPAGNAPADLRTLVESGQGGVREWNVRVHRQLAPEARSLADVLRAGSTIDPQVAASLRQKAQDAVANGASAHVIDEVDALIGSFRDIMEHPADYVRTPEAEQAFLRLRAQYDDAFAREAAAGVWDGPRDQIQQRITEAAAKATARRDAALVAVQRAIREADAVAGPLIREARVWQQAVAKARANALAHGPRYGPVAADPQLARRAARAVADVEALADAMDRTLLQIGVDIAVRADAAAARARGGAAAQLGAHAGHAADLLDRFQVARARTLALLPKGQQAAMAAALDRLKVQLGVRGADGFVKELEQAAAAFERIQQKAAGAALAAALRPVAASARVTKLKAEIRALHARGDALVLRAEAAAGKRALAAQDAFDLAARLAERRVGVAERAAQAQYDRVLRRGAAQAGRLHHAADRYDAVVQGLRQKLHRPVREYVPHVIAVEDAPAARAGVARAIGGLAGFQRDRTFADYRAMALAGTRAATDDAGDLLIRRVTQGSRRVADEGVLGWLRDELNGVLARGTVDDALILPDFLYRALPAAEQGRFRELRDVKLVLGEKDAQQDLAALLLKNAAPGGPLSAVLSAAERRALIGRINAGRVTFYLDPDAARYLENVLSPGSHRLSRWGRAVDTVTAQMRALRLGYDLAMLGMRLPAAAFQALGADITHPWRGTAALATGLKHAFFPEDYRRVVASDAYATAARYMEGMEPGQFDSVLDRPEWIKSLPLERPWEALGRLGGRVGEAAGGQRGREVGEFIGHGPVSAERWQFGVLLPMVKHEMFWQMYGKLRGVKRYAHLTDEELMTGIGHRVDLVVSGMSRLVAGVGADQEWWQRLPVLSPGWARGMTANAAQLAKPGIEGDLARRFWATAVVGGVALSAGLSLVFTNDYSLDHLQRLLDPSHPDAVTNPRGRRFLQVELPDEAGHISLMGPVLPLARALLAGPAAAIGEGVETARTGEGNPAAVLYEAVAAGTLGLLGGSGQLVDWFAGRVSIPYQLWRDLYLKNEDYRGRAIARADDAMGRWKERGVYAVTSLLPGSAGVPLDREQGALPQWDISRRTAADAVLSGFGVNFTPGPRDPEALKERVRDFLAAQGIDGGFDPIGRYRAGDGIPRDALAAFRAANPDIEQHIIARRKERIAGAPPLVGEKAVRTYLDGVALAKDERRQALTAAAGLPGNEYRRAVGAAWDRYFAQVDAYATLSFGTAEREAVQAKVDAARGGRRQPGSDPLERAFDDYFAIRVPADKEDDPEARDAMLEERRAFVQGGVDGKYGAEVGARLRATLRDQYVERGGETYGRYFDAQQVMGEYAAIPVYRIAMEPAQERRVRALLGRAQDLVRMGGARNLRQAVLLDPAASDEEKMLARRIVWRGARAYNPERSRFLQAHAGTLAEFYSSLVAEQVDQLAG